MKKLKVPVTVIVVLLAISAAFLIFRNGNQTPMVPFAKATRETISNTLSTNGKVEPAEFTDIRVDTAGLVKRLTARQGDSVTKGSVLAELGQPGLAEDLAAAEARVAQTRADLETLRGGGASGEIAELDGNLSRTKGLRDAAQKNLESLDRLVSANAATRFEADQARQTVRDLDTQIQSLTLRRGSLVGKGDVAAAEARLREADANLQLAHTRIGQKTIRTPMTGILYDLPAREGAWLNAGDAVGSVGRLDPVRVKVFVDEPELGRVALGQTVRITWDGLPGHEWTGKVDRRPTEVIALGSRQVGEVICAVPNPNHDLAPGTNVNAFILTQVVERALTIPKGAVRREKGVGVYVLNRTANTIAWRAISTGASGALKVEAAGGLNDDDLVALPSDATLRDGMAVSPVLQ